MGRHVILASLCAAILLVVQSVRCAAAVAPTSQPIVWSFNSDSAEWRARAESIALSRSAQPGPDKQAMRGVRISGRIEDGWNYAVSDTRPMAAGQLYRLSAWLRVDKLGASTPMPFLKCEFVAADTRRDLGRASTDGYDGSRMGQWQRLSVEFESPEGTVRCWAALEKGSNKPAEIDAYLAAVRIEPISRLSKLERYRLSPLPPALTKVRGVHPRLYLNEQRVKELREAIKTTHVPQWAKVRAQADRAVKNGPPSYRERDSYSGDEQLWQRDVGNTMPLLAMAWLMSGDRRYLDGVRQWALASCAYKTWGLGRIDGMDLAAGHQLYGLAIVYDWCKSDLDEQTRETIRGTIVRRAGAMFEAAATDRIWWSRAYLQNHQWISTCALAACGMALFDEVEDANLWIGLARDKFRRTMAALGEDGASQEGVGYWEYGAEYMLKYMHLAREPLGEDLFNHPWWRHTAAYAQYLTIPRNAWTRDNCLVDIADCPRGHWYGPEYLLRCLAREYHDGHAQWLAQQADEANVTSAQAAWLNLIWFDATLKAEAPQSLPTLRHFADMGIVSSRSDWSGNESLVVFKCGPCIGHKALGEFATDPGAGHVHPDANHFMLFGCGQWLIRDDGYRAKWTGQHNTLLVNGKGQSGEGQQWFNAAEPLRRKARPKIISSNSSPKLDQIAGDAADAYPPELGLQRFVRHLLYLKPNVLIVADDIELDKPADLELRFHPEQPQAQREGAAFLFRGKGTAMRLEFLTAIGSDTGAGDVAAAGRRGEKDQAMFAVWARTRRARWRNATALSWAAAPAQAPRIGLKADGDDWIFQVDGRAVRLNVSSGKAAILD